MRPGERGLASSSRAAHNRIEPGGLPSAARQRRESRAPQDRWPQHTSRSPWRVVPTSRPHPDPLVSATFRAAQPDAGRRPSTFRPGPLLSATLCAPALGFLIRRSQVRVLSGVPAHLATWARLVALGECAVRAARSPCAINVPTCRAPRIRCLRRCLRARACEPFAQGHRTIPRLSWDNSPRVCVRETNP